MCLYKLQSRLKNVCSRFSYLVKIMATNGLMVYGTNDHANDLVLPEYPGPSYRMVSTLRPRQNGTHFADDIFKWIFLNKNVWISIKISLKFVSKGPINNIPALVQKMAWRRPGDKPLSEPMMVSLPTHICVTRLQWVKYIARHGFAVHRFSQSTLIYLCSYTCLALYW